MLMRRDHKPYAELFLLIFVSNAQVKRELAMIGDINVV